MNLSAADFISSHPYAVPIIATSSLVMLVLSLLVLPIVITRMPHDYFIRNRRRQHRKRSGWLKLIARNIIGTLFIIAGILMLVLPGQGLVTILAGLFVIEARWKYRLERKLVSLPRVLRSINWIRRKWKQPELHL